MLCKKYKELAIAFVLISTLVVYSTTVASAQNANTFMKKKNLHTKMESVLSELEEEHGKGVSFAKEFSSKRNIKIDERNRITIFIYLEEDKPLNIKSLEAHGAEIIKGTHDVIKATVPIGMLRAIANNVEGVSFIKLPDKPVSQVTSQGVSLTGASSYHSAGYTGSGVKVAVIDLGFAGLTSAITNGELSSPIYVFDCTGSGCVNVTPPWDLMEVKGHGTAVAEIIRDMAPESQLYLMKIDDSQDLVDAKNYCIANGIKIINHSVGWFNANFYDGSCYYSNPVCTANDAYSNGILWVNAAGNHALDHYEAVFSDPDGNSWHNEPICFDASGLDIIDVKLTWNAWPVTDQDYDLYLVDSYLNIYATSQNLQTGTQKPTESITYLVPLLGPYSYCLVIKKYSATSNHKMELFAPNHILNPAVTSSSLVSPADASGVLSVAAVNYSNWTTGPQESFSSRGPTTDGRVKPDISGPDGVSNYTMPVFGGTSAAAPHVAGAAALILSANPGYSVSQLGNSLTSSAIDMGSAGKDNIYGYGRLNLPSLKPNLTPYQPSGWSDKIVVSNVTGTYTDISPLYPTDTLYIDLAMINNGTAPTSVIFYIKLYVDGVEKQTWSKSPPLNVNYYSPHTDYSIGALSAGTHTIKIVVDTTNAIDESNEADNEYTKTITVNHSKTLVDFDGDYHSDLAGINSAGNIFYTTDLQTWTPIPGVLEQLVAGYFDEDGLSDLAGINSNGHVFYTTDLATWTNIPGVLTQLVVGDFNKDGQSDLAGVNSNGHVFYSTNLSTWTNIPGVLTQLVAGDFNKDGRSELAGINSNGHVFYTTDLATWTNIPGVLTQLVVGDFNKDGQSDLAGINSNGHVFYTTDLATWTNIPGVLAQLVAGNFDGDGQSDLAGINSNGHVFYTTDLATWTNIPGVLSQLVVGDFDKDGLSDLAGINSAGNIFYTTDLQTWTNIPGVLEELAE